MNAGGEQFRKVLEPKLGARMRKSGHDEDYVCPFCARDSTSGTIHVNYVKRGGVALCHQCDYTASSLTQLVRDVYGFIPESIERFLNRPRMADLDVMVDGLRDRRAAGLAPARIGLPPSFRRLHKVEKSTIGSIILRYLRRRGFTLEEVEDFGLGYVTDRQHGAYGYLIFPFYGSDGHVFYWQGRRVIGDGPKSYNPPSSDKKSFLYGLVQAQGQDTGFVCEGPFDGLAWGPGGLPLTSKVLHPQQVRIIAGCGFKRVIFCLDDTEHERTVSYARSCVGRIGAQCGYLLLRKGDPADNRKVLHDLADTETVWLDPVLDAATSLRSYTPFRPKPKRRSAFKTRSARDLFG